MNTTAESPKLLVTVMGGVALRAPKKRAGSHITMDLPDLVRTLRNRTTMTQAQFGKAVRVTRGAIAAYETGQMNPSFKVLTKMAKLAGLNLSDLLTVPSVKDTQERLADDTTARANLEIVLNSSHRELVIKSLALFAGRSPKATK